MRILLSFLALTISLAAQAEWKNQSELAVIKTGGNSELETYNLKTESTLEQGKRTYSFGGHYTLGTSVSEDEDGEEVKEESARNWDVHGKYTQELTKMTSGFIGIMYEGDEFAGYERRDNYDLGGKYKFVDTKKTKSFATLAYRYTKEKTIENEDGEQETFNDNKGVLYYELKRNVREGFDYKFWIEYVYNFTRTEDYLINLEPSLAFALNETFSVKLAYKYMYDNEPATEETEMVDYVYTTALLANF